VWDAPARGMPRFKSNTNRDFMRILQNMISTHGIKAGNWRQPSGTWFQRN